MILVPNEIKDNVLHALYQGVGLKTAGQGIAFSLPVDDVVGLSSTPHPQEPKHDKNHPLPQLTPQPKKLHPKTKTQVLIPINNCIKF